MIDQVKCDSGITGYRCRMRESYDDYNEWQWYAEMYGLAARMGYDNPEEAWADNPMIQGSVIPSDFRVVTEAEITQQTERTD